MKHTLQPVAPAQCSMSSYIELSEIDIKFHVDTKGSQAKTDKIHSQNIQSDIRVAHNCV